MTAASVLVDYGGYLIMSISVVYWNQGTTVCHNVVDCLQVCNAQVPNGDDVTMLNVSLIIPSPKSLVLRNNNQSLRFHLEDSMTSAILRSLSCPCTGGFSVRR